MEYQIGEFSRITALSIKTLRYYHQEGILEPSRIDGNTGYRFYNNESWERAQTVTQLRSFGFTVEKVKNILENCREDCDVRTYLMERKEEIKRQVGELESKSKKIDLLFTMQEEYETMKTTANIELKQINRIQYASVRYKGRYDQIGGYIGVLMRHAARFAVGKIFCLYHDAEYKDDGADIEVCIKVRKPVNKADVSTHTLNGYTAVSGIHIGPYETLSDSYKRLTDYCKENSYKIQIPIREIYIKGPGMIFKRNPQKYVTEIQLPVS